jgi:hypothetical protein
MFVCWPFEDQGSGNVIQGYSQAAAALGHEVVVYGSECPSIPLDYSLDVESADGVVFVFEWTTELWEADTLDLMRIIAQVPRQRRVIIDGDGNYNDPIELEGDFNHRSVESSKKWIGICDSLADKICQPTLHPLRPNVRSFLFYAYNPAWEMPLDFTDKEFGLIYLGNSKFRWGPMQTLLKAVEAARDRVGRIALVGHGWTSEPEWAPHLDMEAAYFRDKGYCEALGVELMDAVPFPEVITWMNKAVANPILSRPTFQRLGFVTPRFFETLAAGTIPLIGIAEAFILEIYGPAAARLMLGRDGSPSLLEIMERPDEFATVVEEVREHLREQHSHESRLKELVEIVAS